MLAYQLTDRAGLDALTLTEIEEPRPGPKQVVLRLRAASLNYRDLLVLNNQLYPDARLPLVPLSDGVGEVIACGEEVTRLAVGDRVAPIFYQGWLCGETRRQFLSLGGELDGVLAQQIVLDQEDLVLVPPHLSDEQAATLPCAALTAWNALMSYDKVGPDSTVLVQGTGGVSLFVLQFARMAGARVIAISSREDKMQKLRELGADAVINYRETPDWDDAVLTQTGGEGVSHIVDVGGAQTLPRSLNAAAAGGQISSVGVLSGFDAGINLRPVLLKQLRLQGIHVGNRAMFESMNAAIAQHKLQPVIDRTFSFEQAQEAFRYLQAGDYLGKVCIRF